MPAAWRSLAIVFLRRRGRAPGAFQHGDVAGSAATALVMGGTGNPVPDSTYPGGQTDNYIRPFFTVVGAPVGVETPEEFWPDFRR